MNKDTTTPEEQYTAARIQFATTIGRTDSIRHIANNVRGLMGRGNNTPTAQLRVYVDVLEMLERVAETERENYRRDHDRVEETRKALPGDASKKDERPHGRACGLAPHEHGRACTPDCPTCAKEHTENSRAANPLINNRSVLD